MIRKGSSRKGNRRRRSAEDRYELDALEDEPAILNDPIKLEVDESMKEKSFAVIPEIAEEAKSKPKPRFEDEVVLEKHWDSNHVKSSWIWYALAGVAGIAVAVYFLSSYLNAGQKKRTMDDFKQIITVDDESLDEKSPTYIYEANTPKYIDLATKLLFQYTRAQSAEELLPITRTLGDRQRLLTRYWQPWRSLPDEKYSSEWTSAFYAVGKIPVFILSGKRLDHTNFSVYFILENDKFVIDWQATEGICDVPPDRITDIATPDSVIMRLALSAGTFYNDLFPENDYISLQAKDVNDESVFHVYVKRNSPQHFEINKELMFDAVVMEKVSQARFTVKINPKNAGQNSDQLLLTEILHNDWVIP